jgi:hypothetical protein
MVVHLGVQRPLGQRLLQAVDQAVPLQRRPQIGTCQQLVEQGIGYRRGFASGHRESYLEITMLALTGNSGQSRRDWQLRRTGLERCCRTSRKAQGGNPDRPDSGGGVNLTTPAGTRQRLEPIKPCADSPASSEATGGPNGNHL